MNQRDSRRSSAETVESVCNDYRLCVLRHILIQFDRDILLVCPRACSYVVVFCNKFFTWTTNNMATGTKNKEMSTFISSRLKYIHFIYGLL
jgi:hypothetical protein